MKNLTSIPLKHLVRFIPNLKNILTHNYQDRKYEALSIAPCTECNCVNITMTCTCITSTDPIPLNSSIPLDLDYNLIIQIIPHILNSTTQCISSTDKKLMHLKNSNLMY